MKKKYFSVIVIGLTVASLIASVFFAVPASHAQSSEVWSNPINLSNAGSSTNPTMVVDLAGTIHVIWFDQFEGHKYTYSTDGKTWTEPKVVRFPFSPNSIDLTGGSQPEAPVLLADEDGNIHAFWLEETDGGTNTALYYSMATPDPDLTSRWSTRARLVDAVMDFDAVVDSQGIVHIGYVSGLSTKNSNPVGVYYRRRKGTSWSSPTNLYYSQYFRSLLPEEANVHIAVTETDDVETLYMVWDDRPQKRILLSKSLDGGELWEDPFQVQNAEDASGQETPYNINLSIVDNQSLLLWQDGQPGTQCDSYSSWSSDASDKFGPPEKMLGTFVGCPQDSQFISVNNKFSVVSLKILGDISLLAWNGSRWSKPQIQNELTSFINPVTLDSVILGCQKMATKEDQLFVVGCDQGNGGDIWVSSRSLGNIDSWFPPASEWTTPFEVTTVDQQLSELSLVSSSETIHMFWVQPQIQNVTEVTYTIQHAGWNGENWSSSATIISGLNGFPNQLRAYADNHNRLMLAWVDNSTGEMSFSWAEADRANITSEWTTPQIITSVSQSNSSPDILVDESGKIVVAYAIPINEQRGIYFVESDDGGTTWSKPLQAFDAALAGWDIVDYPIIGLSGDGRLHLLFNKYSFQGEPRRSLGLYYSQSADGGISWSDPETVTEHPVLWSKIVGYGEQTLHRLWQEYTQSTLVSFHQVSQDGGVTWSNPIILSSLDSQTSLVTQTMDTLGDLYFLQLTGERNLNVLSKMWNGSSWISQETKDLYIKDRGVPASISASASSKGKLLASILVNYPYLTDELKSSIVGIDKSLGVMEENQTPFPAYINTVEPQAVDTGELPENLQLPTQDIPTVDVGDSPSFLSKNSMGIILLGGILVLAGLIFWPIFRKRDNSKRKSK